MGRSKHRYAHKSNPAAATTGFILRLRTDWHYATNFSTTQQWTSVSSAANYVSTWLRQDLGTKGKATRRCSMPSLRRHCCPTAPCLYRMPTGTTTTVPALVGDSHASETLQRRIADDMHGRIVVA
mmetsp:Transcript_74819/g.148234  ORF Transcript_74819/g.148234 Transcript_74819/m.148234 type:complete len:125 (+) Transcript_74819:556-930(+)